MERFKNRRQFIIPLLLKSRRSKEPIKAVMLNISSKGLRVFSNDQRLLIMSEEVLKKQTFYLDVDFFNMDLNNLKLKVVNTKPGKNKGFEKQLGLAFIDLPKKIARQIDVFVQEYSS